MKIRVLDRILVALAGLIVLALCAGIAAQMFFGTDVVGWISGMADNDSTLAMIIAAAIIAALLAVGAYCVLLLFRHRRRRDR